MSAEPPTEEALARPLHLARICMEKVWGGRALERVLGIELAGEGPVGETWELVDREDHNSVVAEGRWEGQSLHWLMTNEREALLGRARAAEGDRFPLLVKFLSAEQPLSVQVHPDERVAAKLGRGEAGKNEAWYVLEAEEGASIYLGLRPDVGPTEFAAAAGSAEIVDLLQSWKVHAGQFLYVPAGAVHAIGGGITLLEVQQNSDATFRIFDWGRTGLDGSPRKTHVEEALLAARYDLDLSGPITPELESQEGGGHRSAVLPTGDAFRMELVEVCGHMNREGHGLPLALVCVRGAGALGVHGEEPVPFRAGDTWLVPASARKWFVDSKGGDCVVVLAEAPEA